MKKVVAIISFLIISLCCSAICKATEVKVSGRQLLVDDVPFTVKGVCFGSTPVGKGWYPQYDWSKDPDLYNVDFPLIKAMGGNTIRIYDSPTEIAALDAAYDNGIYVIMTLKVAQLDFGIPSVREEVEENFKNMVNQWKGHPAILMWCLGNEQNASWNHVGDIKDWYSLVNECAQTSHELEEGNFHPVTTGNWKLDNIGDHYFLAHDDDMPYLDVWSAQIYEGSSFFATFSDYTPKSTKPLCITEYGCDSWDAVKNKPNEGAQAEVFCNLWTQIEQNLSTFDSNRVCIGGTLHMWADDWCRNQSGSPDWTHDTTPTDDPLHNLYDSYNPTGGLIKNWNEEWCGVVSIFPNTYDKIPKKSYYALRKLWTGEDYLEETPLFVRGVKNYANPFSPYRGNTRIEFTLNRLSDIKIEIYDIAGKRVCSWAEVESNVISRIYWNGLHTEITYQIYWDGRDKDNRVVANGVYVCRIKAKVKNENLTEVKYRRIMVLK
jgi:hypothetical protein